MDSRCQRLTLVLLTVLAGLAGGGAAVGAAGDESPSTSILRAVAAGDADTAVELSTQALRADPDRIDLLYLCASIHADAGRGDEGLALARGLVDSTAHPERLALFQAEADLSAGRFEEALAGFEFAARAFEEQGEAGPLLIARLRQGRCLGRLQRAEEAVAILEPLARQDPIGGYERYWVWALHDLASGYEQKREMDTALALRLESLERVQQIEDPYLHGEILSFLGRLYGFRDEYQQGADFYRQAADHAARVGNLRQSIDWSTRAAGNLVALGELRQSQEILEAALERARQAEYHDVAANTLYHLARGHRIGGQLEMALQACAEMRELDAAHDIGQLSRSRERLIRATTLYDLGRLAESLQALDELEPDAQQMGGNWPLMVLNNRANARLDQGDIDVALELYRQAFTVAEQRRDRGRMAIATANMGGCYSRMGRFEAALESYERALTMFEAMQRDFDAALTHLNLANVNLRVGNLDAALDQARAAQGAFEAVHSERHVPGVLLTIAGVHLERGEYEQARELALEGLRAARETGAQEDVMRALYTLGKIETDQGRHAAAIAHLDELLTLVEQEGLLLQAARAYALLGEIELRRGEPQRAVPHLERAVEKAQRLGSPRFLATPYILLGRSQRALGQREAALHSYDLAIENVETMRWGTGAESERWAVLAENSAAYVEAAALLLENAALSPTPDAVERALHLVEMGRARTLVDRLETLGVDFDRGIPPDLRRARNENLKRTNYLQSNLAAALEEEARAAGIPQDESSADDLSAGETPARRVQAFTAELRELDAEYQRIEGRIRSHRSPFSAMRRFETASSAQLTELLDAESMLLEYFMHEDRAWVFALSRRHGLQVYALSEGIGPLVSEYRRLLEAGRHPRNFDLQRYAELGHQLYLALLAPVLESPPRAVRSLLIAPDAALWTLPFESLLREHVAIASAGALSEAPFLFREFTIQYLPSSTVWFHLCGTTWAPEGAMERAAGPRPLLVMADPVYPQREAPGMERAATAELADEHERHLQEFAPLPYSHEEAERLVEVYGQDRVQLLVGAEASEDRIKAEDLRSYGCIHLAAHSYIDEEHPQRSAVVLSLDEDPTEDGFLTIREIYGLTLDSELVVVSACSSAEGKPIRGEGVIALARPFLATGAANTVVSLWPVNDSSSAAFMVEFHSALAAGQPAPAALRAARDALLASERPAWRLPYHWAAFVGLGAGR